MIDDISFVIPAYNEEGNIASVVLSCCSVGEIISQTFEIIVVNDGSVDDTAKVVKDISERNQHVVLINHKTNRGIATAVMTGFAAARYTHVFYTDGDGQFDVNEITDLLPYCQDYDFVVGYRAQRADPLNRKLNGLLYNLLVRSLFRIPVKDVDCAFKLMKTSSLHSLNACSDSAFYFAELLHGAIKAGMTVREVPVSHYQRLSGRQTGANPRVVIKALKDLVKYQLAHRINNSR
jgi:glycosyltransferase involved in cell wall biosynthesis